MDQIGRRKALVRNGWLAELSGLELKVLDYYEYCADPDGSNARPSLKTIARATGANPGHIRVARVLLVQFELLARQDDGRGGRTTATFRVLTPPRARKGIGFQLRDEERTRRRGGKVDDESDQDEAGADEVDCVESRGAPNEGGSKGAGVKRRSAQKAQRSKARAQGGLEARAQGCANARAPYKEDQSLYQPHDQSPLPGCAGAAEAAGVETAPRRRRPRVLTDEQQAMRLEFSDWWMSAEWPRWNGGQTYGFEGDRDGPAVLRLLRHPKVKWELERAKAIARFYFEQRDSWLVHSGHPLPTLAARVNYYASKLDQRATNGDSHVLRPTGTAATAAARQRDERLAGQFPQHVAIRVLNGPGLPGVAAPAVAG